MVGSILDVLGETVLFKTADENYFDL